MDDRDDVTRDDLRTEALLGRLLVSLLVVPAVVLSLVYVASVVTGILFGNVLFALSGLVIVGWVLVATTGWGARVGAVRPENALLVSADEHYARTFPAGTVRVAREPAPLLVSLTMAVVLGWLVVLVTL